MVGPATSEILELRIVRLMVFGFATDENLRLHFVRLMVFAGPASDRIFVRQTARFEVLTFRRLMLFAGPAGDRNFRAPDCHVCGFDWACRR